MAADRGLLSTYSTTNSSVTTEDESDNLVDSAKLKGPFNTDAGINDNVSLTTGALMYTEKIATIPGKMGLIQIYHLSLIQATDLRLHLL